MIRRAILAAALVALGGCSAAGIGGALVKGALGSGGPRMAANVQAGRTNAQVIGPATLADQRLEAPGARTVEQSTGETTLRTERVERVEVHNEAAPWVWLVALLGWLLPTPGAIAAAIRGAFRRRAPA